MYQCVCKVIIMEIIELDRMRKAFAPASERYKQPYKESKELRYLWTYERRPSEKRANERELTTLYKLAVKYVKDGRTDDALSTVRKGLKLDPRFHQFYALRAGIFMRQSKCTQAIKQYEMARRFLRHSEDADGVSYDSQLAAVYWKRGNWHREHGGASTVKARIDYEQVLAVVGAGPRRDVARLIGAQDVLLETLRDLARYEAYRFYWSKFATGATPARTSDLLSHCASYKIHRRELASARHMLFEALDLDRQNSQAQKLLQTVYGMGHSMAACTVIWCMHHCYEKALLTIEKCRDCDPYNPGYTLLKTIVLRLAGRTAEAAKWLKSVGEGFRKLLEPSRDERGSIMGTLGREETRTRLIEQRHLIRYEVAVRHTIEGRYEEARRVLAAGEGTDSPPEAHVLLGDGFLKQAAPAKAMVSYLRAWDNFRLRDDWNDSPKRIQLIQRIIAILGDGIHEITDDGTERPFERAFQTLEQDCKLPTSVRNRIAILRGLSGGVKADPTNFPSSKQ